MRHRDFTQSRLDSSFWYRLDRKQQKYDYFIHHVDDFAAVGPNATALIVNLEEEFRITGIERLPDIYIGMSAIVNTTKTGWILSAEQYIKHIIPNVEQIIGREINEESTPTLSIWKPWEDDSPLLDDLAINKYQKLVGIGIWIVTIGCIDVCFAVSTLSRYNVAPREGHMKAIIRVYSYLKKYSKASLRITKDRIEWNHPPNFYELMERKQHDMKQCYTDVLPATDINDPPPKARRTRNCYYFCRC
jgi:hypothetical protein